METRKRDEKQHRGVFEKKPGSGIWWIRYFASGQKKREKVGRKSDAIALYQRRKSEIRAGAKLPDNLRHKGETLGVVIDRAILWYTSHRPRSLRTASTHLNLIKTDLGHLVAADLTPDVVDQWVSGHTDWSAATKNRYKATFGRALQLAVVSGNLQRNAARLVTARREDNSYATVVSANHKENQITVQKPDGQQATYDPKRLQGIAAYREISRDFAQGDRIQFTANNRELAVSNRDMGTIERIDTNQVNVKMDGAKERTVTFDAAQMRHFDHGYAVTSHSSQGLTADRVLVNMDTNVHPELINTRFAYVSVSRASEDVRIYTNDVAVLSERLSTDVTKTSAVDLQKAQVEPTSNQQTQTKEPPMTNSREHSQEELRRQILAETITHAPENISATADIEHRHSAPIQTALPNEASDYDWKRETGDVQSYQHNHAGSWLHIDPQGQFYDRQAQTITREAALEQAGQSSAHSVGDNAQVQSGSKATADLGLSL
jgi:hypothetical protein